MNRTHIVTLGALMIAMPSLALAAPPADKAPTAPLEQASASVNKNLQKHPDNKGLRNASQRIGENREKITAHRAAQDDKRADRREAQRPARMERPARSAGRR